MRTALCLLAAASLTPISQAQSPGGVVFVGDVPTIDKAALQAAELSLPPAVSSGPASAPRRQATPTATIAPRAGFGAPSTNQAAEPKTDGGLFGKLKRSWPFGKKEEEPAVDPFAQAKQQARLAAAPAIAPRRDSGVQPIPAVAPTAPARQTAFQNPKTKNRPGAPRAGSRPSRNSGLALRKNTAPSGGLLSGLFGQAEPGTATPPSRVASVTPRVAPRAKTPVAQKAPKPLTLREPAARLAASPRQTLDSVTAAKRKPSAGVAVMISDDAPATPVAPKAAVIAEAKPVAKPMPIVAAPKTAPKPLVVKSEAKPAPPLPTVVAAPKPAPKPIAPQPTAPLPVVVEAPAAIAHVADEPQTESVLATAEPAALPKQLTPAPVARPAVEEEPSDRSRDLLAEAHALAASAADYDAFSAVVQRCRYVLAIDRSRLAREYANQLSSWALTKRGELLSDEGRLEEAIVDYREALVCDPECWKSEHALGVIAARNGEAGAAKKHFDRVIEINPEHAKAFANRAALAVQAADYGAALNDYAEAIAIDPDLATAHTGRGRVCHLVGRLDEGLRHLDAASVLDPSDAATAIGRGDLLTDLGRYGQAIAAYERAITINPSLAVAHRNLAWLRATCPVTAFRDGTAALASAEIAEQLAAADDLTLDTKAAALASVGRFDEAAQLQEEAIGLAPAAEQAPYRERLAMYQRGEAFTSKPLAVEQASYLR